MTAEEQHHVHFGVDEDELEAPARIKVIPSGQDRVVVHLGMLQVRTTM